MGGTQGGIIADGAKAMFTALASKALANSTLEASGLASTSAGSRTLPAGFWAPGKTIRIRGGGTFVTALTPGALTVRVKLGAVVVASAVINNLLAGATTGGWKFDAMLTCRSVGPAGVIACNGQVNYATGTQVDGCAYLNSPGAAVDTTQAADLDVSLQWALGVNTITTEIAVVQVIN